MASLEANQSAPETNASCLVSDLRTFLSAEVGTLSAFMFAATEFYLIAFFWINANKDSWSQIWHLSFRCLLPALLFAAVFKAFIRLKETLSLIDADPKHLDRIMAIFQRVASTAFFVLMMMVG
jgi:hypothetical protein